jgi:hypothetical protein
VSNEIFTKIAELNTVHDMWIYFSMSKSGDLTRSYVVVLGPFMRFEHCISPAKVSPSELNQPLNLTSIALPIYWTPPKLATLTIVLPLELL